MMPSLTDILEEEALADIERIRDEARRKAAAVVHEAEEKASARIAANSKRAEAESLAAIRRARSAADLTVATACMEAKGWAMTAVREKALARLQALAGRKRYAEILVALAEEAMAAESSVEAIVVHPDDAAAVSELAKRKGVELRTDATIRLGVKIVSEKGRRLLENTLPRRLDRAWSGLAAGVAERLWGGGESP